MEAKKPNIIGDYQLGDKLGHGSIGIVYKAINIKTGASVAIKQVSLPAINSDALKSIHKEIQLLSKLNHLNIVKYIDSISTDTNLNIVLEYVESGSLSNLIQKYGTLKESLAAIYIMQTLNGLDYLHKQGIIHRDIKGANLLITKDGVVKLADFGVATKLSETEKSNSIVGTPYWIAPEILLSQDSVTQKCDIWYIHLIRSVGSTILELVTGQPPYFKLDQYPAMYKIANMNEEIALPENISANLKDFLSKCFIKEPSHRASAAQLLSHPWLAQISNVAEIRV